MAWEGADFTRDDLYTLFVTTRILNFLKSRRDGPRAALGEEILETLLASGTLHAASGKTRRPLTRFRADLFFDVWRRVQFVTTLGGRRVEIPEAMPLERIPRHEKLDVVAGERSEREHGVVRPGGHGLA